MAEVNDGGDFLCSKCGSGTFDSFDDLFASRIECDLSVAGWDRPHSLPEKLSPEDDAMRRGRVT